MKTKIARIWSVGVVIAILVSLLVAALPASANELAWSRYDDPTNVTLKIDTGADVTDIAVASDGQTIYVVDNALNRLRKSTNGGKTFSNVTLPAAILSADMVAVAPDNKDVIVVVDATPGAIVAVVSTNGGSSFSNINVPVGAAPAGLRVVTDVAISSLDGSKRYIALAGRGTIAVGDTDDAVLLYFDLGSAVPTWVNAVQSANWDNGAGLNTYFGGAQADIDTISAIAFSPYFTSDLTAVAISTDQGSAGAAGVMKFHILSFNQKKWDTTAGFSGYPVTIKAGTVVGAGEFVVRKAAISLDPAYLGGDDSLRVAFVAADIQDNVVTTPATTIGGLWRLKDTSVKQLIQDVQMYSVAWNGTNLVAGPTDSNAIRRSADAMSTDPTVSSASSLKRPGLSAAGNNTVVAWAGSNVVAGVSGAMSSFAISTDNGATFDEYALIDTAWAAVTDFWVAADGSVVYVMTNDGTDSSLWRKSGSDWARVWVMAGTGTAGYIVRGAKDNKDVLYIADNGGGTNMWFTENGGGRWFPRASRYAIGDVAVESIDTAYVAQNAANSVSKTTNKGFTWGDAKSTSLSGGDNIYSIVSIAKDQLIVGGFIGYISYSVDGNASWTNISSQLNSASPAIATAKTLNSGDYIYAGTAGNDVVQRWQIGTSTSWYTIAAAGTAPSTTPLTVGIGYSEDTLYVMFSDGATDMTVGRTMNPTATTATWSYTALDGANFPVIAPNAMRLSKGSTTIWYYEAATVNLDCRVYTDSLNTVKPVVSAPSTVKTNPASGVPYNVTFSWARPHGATTVATSYRLQVADNEAFNGPVFNAIVVPASTSADLAASVATGAMPGTKYYYRLRVDTNAPLHSNWSATGSFTVEPLEKIPTEIVNPQPPVTIPPAPTPTLTIPQPTITMPAPTINLPAPTTITIPPAPAPQQIAPAYIWAIVVIGAVLVIAVIVLIVRTRRPV